MGKVNINEVRPTDFVEISNVEFERLRDFVYHKIGINLTPEKRNLLMSRLQKVLRRMKIKSFSEYYDFVVNDSSGEALSELANVISTNHTFFGREADHFEYFQKVVLPEIEAAAIKRNTKNIRVWCAGCSSGEEPYTLVMLMMDYFGKEYDKWNAGVLATDISLNALGKAAAGVYPDERVRPLDEKLKKKYFKPQMASGEWEVIDRLKKEVTYRRFNLMNDFFPFKDVFDVIFCRNVMIYFDNPTREALVNKFYQFTADGGYLFIGHSETVNRDKSEFKYVKPAIYKHA